MKVADVYYIDHDNSQGHIFVAMVVVGSSSSLADDNSNSGLVMATFTPLGGGGVNSGRIQ